MPVSKIDPKVIFASDAPAIDKPPVFSDKTKGWDVARANDGRPQIKEMNKIQQDTDLKILWLNENAVLPYDASIDYPDGAVMLKDGSFKQLSSGLWVEFLDDFADKDAVKRGIANRYDSSLTYNSGERIILANGDIVKSTVDGNTNNPNTDMTGWIFETILTLDSISELSNRYGVGAIAFVKDTDSFYIYDASSSAISVNGWSLISDNTIKTKSLNIQDGADITSLIEYASSSNIFVELERSKTFTTTVFDLGIQKLLIGDGSVQFIYDYLTNDNTENVAPKIAKPYKKDSIYGWYDSVQARGNFEHGAGRGLIVNDDGARPQICGFRTKQQQKNYPSVDIVGQYTHVMSPKVETLTNCTFTTNSVTSASITSDLDIKVGDFIVTEGDPAIGKPWRSEVTAIDYATKTIGVTWWLHESGDGEGTPPDGLSCYTPYANGLWGENTNVFIRADDKVTTVIGYELGVATEKTRDKFSQIVGHYVVNLTSNTARAQTAYKVGGKWDQALLVDDCTAAVVTSGLGKYAVDYTANTDLDSAAVIMRSPLANGGNLSRSVSGLDVLYNVDFAGVQSALKLTYSIHSANIAYNGLQPSLCIGANSGGVAHTTTISTVRMFAGHILEFKQLEAVNWTIIAGGNTFVLNSSGAMDYLKILYDGNFFIKMFAGKSL